MLLFFYFTTEYVRYSIYIDIGAVMWEFKYSCDVPNVYKTRAFAYFSNGVSSWKKTISL